MQAATRLFVKRAPRDSCQQADIRIRGLKEKPRHLYRRAVAVNITGQRTEHQAGTVVSRKLFDLCADIPPSIQERVNFYIHIAKRYVRRIKTRCRIAVAAVIPQGRTGQKEAGGTVARQTQVYQPFGQPRLIDIGGKAQRIVRHLHGESYTIEIDFVQQQFPVDSGRSGIFFRCRIVHHQGDGRVRKVYFIQSRRFFAEVDAVGLCVEFA